ncbi:MAG: biotin/lipoyl-binding protein [Planctomycetes bacterium]|nr:biotin/lipoyl-binding protein [Planctomycetota bacterium]
MLFPRKVWVAAGVAALLWFLLFKTVPWLRSTSVRLQSVSAGESSVEPAPPAAGSMAASGQAVASSVSPALAPAGAGGGPAGEAGGGLETWTTVESRKHRLFYAEQAGILRRLLVREGERVTQGQLLAEFDTRDVNVRIRKQELAIAQTERQVKQENPQWSSDTARENAQDRLESARQDMESAQVALEKMSLRCPFESAVVSEVHVKEGAWISSGAKLLALLDPSDLFVRAYVPAAWLTEFLALGEDDAVRVTLECEDLDRVRARHPALPWFTAFVRRAPTITSVAASPDGAFVVTGSSDGVARLCASGSGALAASLPGHTGGVRAVAFSPDGAYLCTLAGDGVARVFRRDGFGAAAAGGQGAAAGRGGPEPVFTVGGPAERVESVVLASRGEARETALFAGLESGEVRVFSAGSGERVLAVGSGAGPGGGAGPSGSAGAAVTALAVASDGALAFVGRRDGRAHLYRVGPRPNAGGAWREGTPDEGWSAPATGEPVRAAAMAFTDHDLFAFAREGGAAFLGSVDIQTMETTVRPLEAAACGPVRALAFSPDGRRLAGGGNTAVALWYAATGEPMATLAGHAAPVTAVVFVEGSSAGDVATACADGAARVYATGVHAGGAAAAGRPVAVFSGHAGPVAALAAFAVRDAGGGRRAMVLTGAGNNSARLFDLGTGRVALALAGHDPAAFISDVINPASRSLAIEFSVPSTTVLADPARPLAEQLAALDAVNGAPDRAGAVYALRPGNLVRVKFPVKVEADGRAWLVTEKAP